MSKHDNSTAQVSLSVNLNKIALIRNSRDGNFPNINDFAKLCIDAGVDGLTVHPRPDQRHIRPDDVRLLATMCKEANIEFNIEGNPFAPPRGSYPGLLALVEETNPTQCTLVPDSDSQLTSDHGFDMEQNGEVLRPILTQLRSLGVRSSLFLDPAPKQIQMAQEAGADRIELYTGPYAWAYEQSPETAQPIFDQHCEAALFAQKLGLGINAGHDLNLKNMAQYRTLPGLQEVSIGHALTVDALLMGFTVTVKEYLAVCG